MPAPRASGEPQEGRKTALDKEGIEQCGYVAAPSAALEAQVDVIVSSSLKRATRPHLWLAMKWV